MTTRTRKPIPEWMTPFLAEPYRSCLTNTGGNDPAELLDDLRNNDRLMRTNVVRFTLAVAVEAQMGLLARLRSEGLLIVEPTGGES